MAAISDKNILKLIKESNNPDPKYFEPLLEAIFSINRNFTQKEIYQLFFKFIKEKTPVKTFLNGREDSHVPAK